MRRIWKLTIIMLSSVFILFSSNTSVFAQSPYYTYTSDHNGKLIDTQTAYNPVQQLGVINGERLKTAEHAFVDEEDYIYITDSTLNKVFILDKELQFVRELTSEKFSAIKSTFVTENEIYVVDSFESKIYVFDKVTHELVKEIGEPDSPIFKEGYKFSPTHIAVDIRGNMYVRNNESVNGLLMLNREGEFITFFGANPLKVPLLDQIRSFFLTKKQEKKLEKVFPDVPSNIAIDAKGFLYTVTSSVEKNPIKKFNVSGTNYFPDKMIGTFGMESIFVSKNNNVYAVSSDGWIFEYNSEGDLLFLFGGKDFSSSRFGLLNRPVSIAATSTDELIVIDQGQNLIQTYAPTKFADSVHEAMNAYQDGEYTNSKDLWAYTLKYNSIFDNAHIGLGDAYLREGEYQKAYEEYNDANDTTGISEAFWEIRQEWFQQHLQTIFQLLLVTLLVWLTNKYLNKKYRYLEKFAQKSNSLKRFKMVDDFLYIFSFLKRPLDGFYEIHREKRVAKRSSTLLFILCVGVYLLYYKYTNLLFVPVNEYILYELMIVVFLFILWLVSSYLVATISDGEGSFSSVYNGTAYVLSPLILVVPIVVLVSNGLTLEQIVFFKLPLQAMFVWIAFMLFFMIKDIHNYHVGETFSVIVKSVFTMLIIGLFLFVLYSVGNQLISFLFDVVTEVSKRW